MGIVIEKLGPRKAEMIEMKNPGQGLVRLRVPHPGARPLRLPLRVPHRHARHRASCITGSSSTGRGPAPLAGPHRAACSSPWSTATIIAFALGNLQERSTLFVAPGDDVYEGMIIGENARPGDMDVNPTKEKKLTNMRSKSPTTPSSSSRPRRLTLEGALEYIEEDELIEITPQSIRLRKRTLLASDRKRTNREAKRERS